MFPKDIPTSNQRRVGSETVWKSSHFSCNVFLLQPSHHYLKLRLPSAPSSRCTILQRLMEVVDCANGNVRAFFSDRIECIIFSGDIREDYGIHRVEGTFWILDLSKRRKESPSLSDHSVPFSSRFLVNANQSILPNITLGYQIRDSCWYAPVALEQTIEFIGNSVLTSGDAAALANGSSRARLAAIIGPGDSSITMQTHNILQLFEMPQIGYSATAKQLSDKEKFRYFTRVIASDTQQAQAIVDIIRQFRWSYVATIGTEGESERRINQHNTLRPFRRLRTWWRGSHSSFTKQ